LALTFVTLSVIVAATSVVGSCSSSSANVKVKPPFGSGLAGSLRAHDLQAARKSAEAAEAASGRRSLCTQPNHA